MERKTVFEREWRALGTEIYVQVVGIDLVDGEMEKIFSDIKNIYQEKEIIFSRFNPQSELSKINARLGVFVNASSDMLQVAERSLEYFKESDGFFDPRIIRKLEEIGYMNSFKENDFSMVADVSEEAPRRELRDDLAVENGKVRLMQRLDFSGIAKGYITDRAADFLRENGFDNFLVDSGGDMFAQGKNSSGEDWGISLEGSEDENEVVVEISSEAIATSGNVRRNWAMGEKKFHHIINPYDVNDFSFELQSVTVVEKTVERADVMAKVLFLLGLERGLEFADRKRIKALFLNKDGKIIRSKY